MNIPEDLKLYYFYQENGKHLNLKKIDHLIETGMTESFPQNDETFY